LQDSTTNRPSPHEEILRFLFYFLFATLLPRCTILLDAGIRSGMNKNNKKERYIMDPSKEPITQEITSQMLNLVAGAAKLHRLSLAPEQWERIVYQVLQSLKRELRSFLLFSELRNGIYHFHSGAYSFEAQDGEKAKSENMTYRNGLTCHVRCVRIYTTRPRVIDEHDTRHWHEILLTQDGQLLVWEHTNLKAPHPVGRVIKMTLSSLSLLRFGLLMAGHSGQEYEPQDNWEQLLDTLLYMCNANINKKIEGLESLQEIYHRIKAVRQRITSR
jgi:hypothetical protein